MTTIFILYCLFIAAFCFLSFLALYQIWQFGYKGDATKRAIVIYISVNIILIITSLVAFFLIIS